MNNLRFFFFGLICCLFVCCASSQKRMSTLNDSLQKRNFKLTIEETISEIGNVYFDTGSFELDEISASKLHQVVQILSANPILEILVVTHTDSKGDELYNTRLSEKRGEIIKLFFMKSGVSENRIYLAAFGEKKIINRCSNEVVCDESLHYENRRAEFIVFSD